MIGGSPRARGADFLTQHPAGFRPAASRLPAPQHRRSTRSVIDAERFAAADLGHRLEIDYIDCARYDCEPALIDPSQLSTAILEPCLENGRLDADARRGKLTMETRKLSVSTGEFTAAP